MAKNSLAAAECASLRFFVQVACALFEMLLSSDSVSLCPCSFHAFSRASMNVEWTQKSGRFVGTTRNDADCFECGKKGHFARSVFLIALKTFARCA